MLWNILENILCTKCCKQWPGKASEILVNEMVFINIIQYLIQAMTADGCSQMKEYIALFTKVDMLALQEIILPLPVLLSLFSLMTYEQLQYDINQHLDT